MTPAQHLALAHELLKAGHFLAGWREYEWRWQAGGLNPEQFPQPLWNGEALEGRTILLWAEQGLGDTIQFIRLARQVHNMGARVVVECQPALVRLLRSAAGLDLVVPYGETLPPFDYHLPLQSLPRLLGLTVERIPAAVPYLAAEARQAEAWQQALARFPRPRISITWSGNPQQARNRWRSVPLDAFAPLAAVQATFFSLQKQTSPADHPPGPLTLLPLAPYCHDLADSAAALAAIDLVISCDTSVAHLAGALGRSVWVLLDRDADWRWMEDRQDSPWYPTMRLFRQTKPGDWKPVLEQVAAELLRLSLEFHQPDRQGRCA